MRVSGLVPEREAAEAGGGQQGWTWQRCLLHEGGRQVETRRTCPLLLFPTQAALCHASLGLSFYLQNGWGHPCPAHGLVKTSGRTLYREDLMHSTRAVPQYAKSTFHRVFVRSYRSSER